MNVKVLVPFLFDKKNKAMKFEGNTTKLATRT